MKKYTLYVFVCVCVCFKFPVRVNLKCLKNTEALYKIYFIYVKQNSTVRYDQSPTALITNSHLLTIFLKKKKLTILFFIHSQFHIHRFSRTLNSILLILWSWKESIVSNFLKNKSEECYWLLKSVTMKIWKMKV